MRRRLFRSPAGFPSSTDALGQIRSIDPSKPRQPALQQPVALSSPLCTRCASQPSKQSLPGSTSKPVLTRSSRSSSRRLPKARSWSVSQFVLLFTVDLYSPFNLADRKAACATGGLYPRFSSHGLHQGTRHRMGPQVSAQQHGPQLARVQPHSSSSTRSRSLVCSH